MREKNAVKSCLIDHNRILCIGVELACIGGSCAKGGWGDIIKKGQMKFAFKKTPRISLSCKLVPVQYRDHQRANKNHTVVGIVSDVNEVSIDDKCIIELRKRE